MQESDQPSALFSAQDFVMYEVCTMWIRCYTLEKERPDIRGNTKRGWKLVSYRNDIFPIEDKDVQDLSVLSLDIVRNYVRKATPFALFTCDRQPEAGYSLSSCYVKASAQRRAVECWARGEVEDRDELRIFEK